MKPYHTHTGLVYASPGGCDLAMDIYVPYGTAGPPPVIVIYHGGAWLLNDRHIMDQTADYLCAHGGYVVCNVDYRLLSGDGNTVTIDGIVGDAIGAFLWIRAHIKQYGGDPSRIILSGDSAGAHLAAMVIFCCNKTGTALYGPPDWSFVPSYQPTASEDEPYGCIMGGVLNYGVFDMLDLSRKGFETDAFPYWDTAGIRPRGLFGPGINHAKDPEYYRGVSPRFRIPDRKERKLPPLLFTLGTEDDLIDTESVERFLRALHEAGHTDTRFWLHRGRPHAFLDSGSNKALGISFERDAVPALDVIIEFIDGCMHG